MRPLDEYVAYWKQRGANQVKVDVDMRDRAMREARRLATVLAQDYGAKKVYLLGSLAKRERPFTATSDIDLAVDGLASSRFYEALGDLLTRTAFTVDLKPLEGMPEFLRSRIGREGVLLYG